MLKKIALILMTAALLLCGLLTAQAGSLSQADIYAELQAELHRCLDGEADASALGNLPTQFESLGNYKKCTQFSYYAAILRDTTNEDFSQLALYTRLLRMDTDFCAMLPKEGFPTVDAVEAYSLGRQAEASGDWNAAIGYYEQSIAVMDSMTRVMELLTAEPTATPMPVPTATPESTATAAITPIPQLADENICLDDYIIDAYSNKTCVIKDYLGYANTLIIPERISEYQVTGIGFLAFADCHTLTDVSIPNSVTSIGDLAFRGCRSLCSISLPDSIISIGNNPWRSCKNLRSIIISPNHPTLIFSDGVLIETVEGTLICGLHGENPVIPDGTLAIGDFAFYGCNMTSLVLPDGVISIGRLAFGECWAMTNIVLPHSIKTIGDNAFFLCSSLTDITLPENVAFIGENAFRTNSQTSTDNGWIDSTIRIPLRVPAGSYAQQYAIDNNIPYTTY